MKKFALAGICVLFAVLAVACNNGSNAAASRVTVVIDEIGEGVQPSISTYTKGDVTTYPTRFTGSGEITFAWAVDGTKVSGTSVNLAFVKASADGVASNDTSKPTPFGTKFTITAEYLDTATGKLYEFTLYAFYRSASAPYYVLSTTDLGFTPSSTGFLDIDFPAFSTDSIKAGQPLGGLKVDAEAYTVYGNAEAPKLTAVSVTSKEGDSYITKYYTENGTGNGDEATPASWKDVTLVAGSSVSATFTYLSDTGEETLQMGESISASNT